VVMARLEMQFAQWMENVVGKMYMFSFKIAAVLSRYSKLFYYMSVSMDTAVHQLCIAITKQLHLHQ
jgi:hypothetical protein